MLIRSNFYQITYDFLCDGFSAGCKNNIAILLAGLVHICKGSIATTNEHCCDPMKPYNQIVKKYQIISFSNYRVCIIITQ